MCNAFSCWVTRSGQCYWKTGVDSHSDIRELHKEELSDDDSLTQKACKVEIVPKDGNYLYPEREWVFNVDENITPEWFKKKHEGIALSAWEKWKKEIYSMIDLERARTPIHPFEIKPPKIARKHLLLLREWGSIRDSAWDSIWASVWASVRASVWDSVWASVGAYLGSFFIIKKWKKKYPYQSCVDLWKLGLVPSYDGKNWRLHGGPGAKILWKGTIEDLERL